jgi:hypothetical protein
MKPGDLVIFKKNKGMLYQRNFVLMYLNPLENGWCKLLSNDGIIREARQEIFDVVYETR